MNNSENNNDLNVISLGGVENTDISSKPIDEMPAMSQNPQDTLDQNPNLNNNNDVAQPVVNDINQIPTMENAPVEPMANTMPVPPEPVLNDGGEIPAVPAIPDINQVPTAPTTEYDVPEVMNNVNVTPFLNEIGTVPPIPNVPTIPTGPVDDNIIQNPEAPTNKPEKPKKKGGMNKLLFVIIIILALAAVGVGVYVLLGTAREKELAKKPSVTPKEVVIELGGTVSTDINDYAEFKNYDSATCDLDTTKITDTTALGVDYEFTITCADKTYTGKATVKDTIAPKVTTKEVEIMPNGTVLPEQFIETCDDASECTYSFKNEEDINQSVQAIGEYNIVIVARDAAGNKTEVSAKLIVSEVVVTYYLNCSKENVDYRELLKLGIANKEFVKTGIKEYTFSLSDEEYTNLKIQNANATEITYKDITGSFEFNDNEHTLIISKTLTYEELVSEANGEVPLEYEDLKAFYEGLNYSCTMVNV